MARQQPVQVQRIGLRFLRHYGIWLPLIAVALVLVAIPIMRRADPVSSDVMFFFAIGLGLVAAWVLFGTAFSLFGNPFATSARTFDTRRKRFSGFMADRHIAMRDNDPELQIIWKSEDDPDDAKAKAEVYRIRMEGGRAITEAELDRSLWVALIKEAFGLVKGFFLAKLPFLLIRHGLLVGAAILAWVCLTNTELLGTLFLSLVLFGVPFVILFWRPLKIILWLLVEEHPFFQRLFRQGIGGPSGSFASLRQFAQMDMSGYFDKDSTRPPISETSDIYLGRTPELEDVRLFGRHVGLKDRDTNLITVARPGSGKSRDAIWNTILNYAGGVVCFDPKGEHYRIAGARRAKRNPVYVLDPYGSVKDIKATDYWNPLDEIDLDSVAAREQIANLAAASIEIPKNHQDAHFPDTARRILRGLITHVLTKYEPKDRHLGTVYDLLVTGEPEGKYYNPKSFLRLIEEMALNPALAGAAVEAANTLNEVGERERGSILSTMARGVNWMNSPAIRQIIGKPSTFSLRQAKTAEASIFLVLPDDFISQNTHFLRTFFGLAGEVCGDYFTAQPEGSKRRVLLIFDEFSALGHFEPAQEIILRKRGSGIKCWFLLQNLGQLREHYSNVDNFITSSDKQFFGIDRADTYTMELLVNALGQYTDGEGRPGQPLPFERIREVFTNSDIAQWTNAENNGQIVLPANGKPMKLRRVSFTDNFSPNQYGKQKTTA